MTTTARIYTPDPPATVTADSPTPANTPINIPMRIYTDSTGTATRSPLRLAPRSARADKHSPAAERGFFFSSPRSVAGFSLCWIK